MDDQSLPHCLTMEAELDLEKNDLKNLLVCVRILCLSIEYCDMSFLMIVGEKISKLVKIDEATSLVSRGHFVC